MDLTPYVSNLRQELAVAADAGGDDARALAERLTAPLEPAVRLVLLDALAAAAAGVPPGPPPAPADAELGGDAPTGGAAVGGAGPAGGGGPAAGHAGRRGRGGGADQLPPHRIPQGPDRGGRRPGGALGQRLARPRGRGRAGVRRPRPRPRAARAAGRAALHRLGAVAPCRPAPHPVTGLHQRWTPELTPCQEEPPCPPSTPPSRSRPW